MTDELEKINSFGITDNSNANSDDSNNVIKDSDLTYDNKFKQLFTKKRFLAPILKNIIPEYKDCSLETIENFINPHGDIEINPAVYSSEDSGKGNETITHYDVLVDCALPGGTEVCVDLFVDLEMQRESIPGYPIPKRGVYYCCRLISRQIEVLGKKSYYQLKPVYSVWILVNDIPKNLQNSVYTAGLLGSFDHDTTDASKLNEQIDLIHLCLIYLSDKFKVEENQNDLIKYLQSVFTRKVDDPNCNPYYAYSSKIKKEIDEMMSIRESFELRGERRGERRGEIKGKIELLVDDGKTDTEIIKYLTTMKKRPLTKENAIEALKSYYEKNE